MERIITIVIRPVEWLEMRPRLMTGTGYVLLLLTIGIAIRPGQRCMLLEIPSCLLMIHYDRFMALCFRDEWGQIVMKRWQRSNSARQKKRVR